MEWCERQSFELRFVFSKEHKKRNTSINHHQANERLFSRCTDRDGKRTQKTNHNHHQTIESRRNRNTSSFDTRMWYKHNTWCEQLEPTDGTYPLVNPYLYNVTRTVMIQSTRSKGFADIQMFRGNASPLPHELCHEEQHYQLIDWHCLHWWTCCVYQQLQ